MIEFKDDSPEARAKQKECYLKMYHLFRDTLLEYYGNDVLTLNVLVNMLAPLCSSLIHDHIEGISEIVVNQQPQAMQEVSRVFRDQINFLTDKSVLDWNLET